MTKVFLDSINGGKARLLYNNEEFVLPAVLLPEGVREGDTLSMTLKIDVQATQNAKKECEDLLAQLVKSNC